jgi:hypothetical protein
MKTLNQLRIVCLDTESASATPGTVSPLAKPSNAEILRTDRKSPAA